MNLPTRKEHHMHHVSSGKSSRHAESAKTRRFLRIAALSLVVVGGGVSLHLYAIHVSYWWLPLVVVLVLGHAAIIGGIVGMIACLRGEHDASAAHADHEHGGHSHVLRNPRAYDWLARVITLGGERKFRRRTLDLAELQSGDAVLDVGCGTGLC
jgi:hypothetical protein